MHRAATFFFLALSLLALFPTPTAAQDPAAERLFAEALRVLEGGDPSSSLKELQLLVQQFPTDRLAPKALLQIADIQRALGQREATVRALEQLRSEYGRSLESAAAFVRQAEIEAEEARRVSDLEAARATFRRVPLLYGRESYPELEDRVRARLRTGEISLQLGDNATAVAELLAAVEDEAASHLTGRTRLLLATALTRTGEWVAAAEVLQRLAAEEGAATSTEAERAAAIRQLSLIHRQVIRPQSGLPPWLSATRYPASGLQLKEPTGVAAAEDGRLVIVDQRLPLVALIGADGAFSESIALRDAGRPGWSSGAAYTVTETRILLPFVSQESPRFLEPVPGKEKPLKGLQAAERGPFGDWFVLAKGWRSLLAFQSARQGQELLATSKPEPKDIAQDFLGRIYVLDGKGKQVLRLGVDRRQADVLLEGAWRRPVAITVDLLGNLYVLDRGNRTIDLYDANGRKQSTLGPVLTGGIELRNPVDLAVDGSGRLFIADSKLPYVILLD
ncbi:MAG: tetratricopeptide repeat protein [Acidobacteriota bacterium]